MVIITAERMGIGECWQGWVLLSWGMFSWSDRWLGVTTASTLVDLLYSGYHFKCLSYIGAFVIRNQELNKSG